MFTRRLQEIESLLSQREEILKNKEEEVRKAREEYISSMDALWEEELVCPAME